MKNRYVHILIYFFIFCSAHTFSYADSDVLPYDGLSISSLQNKTPNIADVDIVFDTKGITKLISLFENIKKSTTSFAIFIFTSLLVINILFITIKNFLTQDEISIKSLGGELIWTILCAVMFYALFIDGNYLISFVYKAFEGLFTSQNTSNLLFLNFKELETPEKLLGKILSVVSNMLSDGLLSTGWNFFLWALVALCALLFLILIFISVLILFMIYVEFWIVFSLSMFFLMFFTLPQTKDIAMRFVFYCLSISAQLFVGSIFLVSILQVVTDFNAQFTFGSCISLIFLGLIAYFGIQKIPGKVASLFEGSSSFSSGITAGLVGDASNQALRTGLKSLKTAGGLVGIMGTTAKGISQETGLKESVKAATKNVGGSMKEAIGQDIQEKLTGTPKTQNSIGKTLSKLQEKTANTRNET